MDNTRRQELWDRLDGEPERAYRAFEIFLTLPSGERTVLDAYRRHVGNPQAAKPSDTWSGWSRQHAWRERAAAYDDHLAGKRREAYERGVVEEAERQGALAERTRNRMHELMTLGYDKAIEWLDRTDFKDLRAQDVIQIVKLHIEVSKAFGQIQPDLEVQDLWTEEDDREFAETILMETGAEADAEDVDEGKDSSNDVEDA